MINVQAIKEQINLSPQSCGVYKMIGDKNKILYIGKAKNLKSRLSNYVQVTNLSERIRIMISKVVKIEVFTTENEIEALLLEAQLIKSLKPPYNILLKDGRSYPYITISKHEYPKIEKSYYVKFKKKEFYYYGPFPSATAVKNTIELLQGTFKLRICSDKHFHSTNSPCFEYQVKRCSAPCVNKITKEDYTESVKQAQNTLLGKNKKVVEELLLARDRCSETKEYERAAVYRDRLESLKQIQIKAVDFSFEEDADFLNIARMGDLACVHVLSFRNESNYGDVPYFIENCNDHSDDDILSTFLVDLYHIVDLPLKIYVPGSVHNIKIIEQALCKATQKSIKILYAKSSKECDLLKSIYDNSQRSLGQKLIELKDNMGKLKELAKIFLLPNAPKCIEIYDNSHIFGSHQVGVMVVAGQEGLARNKYRKFTIKGNISGDDYKMMEEVLTRRFSSSIKDVIPDFLLIDGGPGHVSIVKNVLKKLNISVPFACMAKGPDRNAGKERFYMPNREEFSLANDNQVMLYLQLLRNEAHRFAITTHRKKRAKQFIVSQLDKIPGIGDKKRRALISHFGSVEKISKASITEIQNVPGINAELAKKIYHHTHTCKTVEE